MNLRSLVVVLGTMLTLTGCGGGSDAAAPSGGTSSPSGSTGTLQVSLTDAPACGYDEVNVTVIGVRVHQSDTAGDEDGGWVDLPLATPYQVSGLRVNLLDLSNGALQGLGQVVLPAGRYTQMRLLLAANAGNAAPFANSVLPTGGVETALATPSAQQSGLKLKLNAEVPAGQVAHVVIDFDACKSVVKRGNSGRYNLKPVLSATLLLSDVAGMRVAGWVGPLLSNAYTQVSLQFGGVPVKATVPDSSGRFVLFPVPVGNYDLVITAPGHATAVLTGVPVAPATDTAVNSAEQRIDTPLSDTRAVVGTVAPATAQVRALQELSGGPKVEVAWSAVDGDSGAFGLSLPTAAPLRISYLSASALLLPPLPLPFTPDVPVQGRYDVEAASAGQLQTRGIDVLVPVLPLSFVFP